MEGREYTECLFKQRVGTSHLEFLMCVFVCLRVCVKCRTRIHIANILCIKKYAIGQEPHFEEYCNIGGWLVGAFCPSWYPPKAV